MPTFSKFETIFEFPRKKHESQGKKNYSRSTTAKQTQKNRFLVICTEREVFQEIMDQLPQSKTKTALIYCTICKNKPPLFPIVNGLDDIDKDEDRSISKHLNTHFERQEVKGKWPLSDDCVYIAYLNRLLRD